MEFNLKEYALAMDKLIVGLERVPSEIHTDNAVALAPVCRVLRISRIDIEFYVNTVLEEKGIGLSHVLYDEGGTDFNRCQLVREIAGNGSIGAYKFYPFKESEEWSEEEIEHINVVGKAIFSFHGRRRVMRLADEMMYKDPVLGVYNSNYYMKRLDELISEGKIGRYGACYFNISRFSVVNDRVGRQAGTEIMRSYITKIQSYLGSEECIVRIGGDTFAVLFLKENLQNMLNCMCGVSLNTNIPEVNAITLSSHSGFYMIPDDCHSSSMIVDRIGAALNVSKYTAKVPYVFYDEKTQTSLEHSKLIETLLPEAIENEEFLVYYQPKVQLNDYRICGAEALCRWKHCGDIIPPAEFIPVLEQSHSICILDFYMLEHVCRDIRRWLDSGIPVVKVSVNFSRVHLGNLELTNRIIEIIEKYRVPHEYIEVELTETSTDVNFNDLKQVVNELRSQGISTSVDDFGIGYSSLNLIRELPWNVLKLDKSFLPAGKKGEGDEKKSVMLKYVIAMAQNLGLECIVEGVETEEQIELLKNNNCCLAQGFYFDRPLPPDVFEERLKSLTTRIKST